MVDSGNDEDTQSRHTANSLGDLDDDDVDADTKQSAAMQQITTMDHSMKFNDLLQEIEDENNSNISSNISSTSIIIGGDMGMGMGIGSIQNNQYIGSELQLDDLPSSSNWGKDFMGSFRKRMGNSLRFTRRNNSNKETSPTKSDEDQDQGEPEQQGRRKKVVRFKNFETIFPSWKK